MSDVTAYHDEVVSRVSAVLAHDLVGVYAGGSFALGGYDPRRSDLDVGVVCRSRLADDVKVDLGHALRHEVLPCPARALELVVYPESSVRRPTAEPAYELDLNTGRGTPLRLSLDPAEAPGRHWYAIDRAILREHGLALAGPPAAEVFAEIPREVLLGLLVESLDWHETAATARADDAVLNACRAWHYAVEGRWTSKPAAGAWARSRAGAEDAELIAEALATRLDDRPLARGRSREFLRRARRLVERARQTAARRS